MFYKARSKETGGMWDVWVVHHDGTYYLYSVCCSKPGSYDNFSMARSSDGVHWTEIGPVLLNDDGKAGMGTGSTWRNPVPGGKPPFQINYSRGGAERQTIFFAQSDDLIHWTKCGPQHDFVQDERWYERNGRWDCIWTLARPGGGLYGYWTATPKPETCGQFGFGESDDGITWKALKPPFVSGVYSGEVGAIEKVGDLYVMLFGTGGRMETLIADKPQGPFRVVARNRVFLHGLPHTYFARFFQSPSGLLVCHHSITRDGEVSTGLLKGTNFDADGTLRLTWWPGNEALKHKPVAVGVPSAGVAGPIAMLGCALDASYGFVLEGTLQLPRPLGAPRGLYVEHGKNVGMAILFNSRGGAEIGQVGADGAGFKAEKTVDRETRFGVPARFRLVVRGVLMEVYLDNILIECHSLPTPATGRIGLIRGDRTSSIRELKAWINTWQKLPRGAPKLVVRNFKASVLQAPTADISTVRPPRPGLARQPVPFIAADELADIRPMHGGENGVVYIEAAATLPRASRGTLAYGADGPVKVWVNGRAVDCQPEATNPARIGEYETPVSWKKGVNRITFALATNHGRAWGVQARVMRSRA